MVPELDQSQLAFCRSRDENIRLLAPAGCGKTASLLYRCLEIARNARSRPRFLILTFTNSAATELTERLINDNDFVELNGIARVTTLNAYGWSRIRDRLSNPRLLTTSNDKSFAMRNQLRPIWNGNQHIEPVVKKWGQDLKKMMEVMDNLKSMGFDHTEDSNFIPFRKRLNDLSEQGLSWRIGEQFDVLTQIGVLESPKKGEQEGPATSHRQFYNRFFTFWRKAVESLLEQSTFTFEDQKYWTYLELKSPGPDGKRRPYITGAARYSHVLVDEFQDINPLDLLLIKAIADRNRAEVTIVGDDDQAIYEWRGASPEYILHPDHYFETPFKDYLLQINYRSPKNIVELSQRLISHNENRVAKRVSAVENADSADIKIVRMEDTAEQLEFVTKIVRDARPGKVAVISRLRRQLIPYEIYYASDGAPFKVAPDLNVFSSDAFDNLTKLIEIWERAEESHSYRRTVRDVISICNLIKRFPLNKKDRPNLERYLQRTRPRTAVDAAQEISSYDGPALSGKSHTDLQESTLNFLTQQSLPNAIKSLQGFAGLRFDQERAEEDVWYAAPPLQQLAEIAESEDMQAADLIERIEFAEDRIKEYDSMEASFDKGDTGKVLERPLHLMTAHRAKGKEFDTVVILDAVDGIWPRNRLSDDAREIEAERRLFYVAFTRARKKVVLLTQNNAPLSPFIHELGLAIE